MGPPPPGATRGLGVLAFCCQPPVYASQRPLSMIVNASARKSIHPSAWKVDSSKFVSLAENSSVSWQPPAETTEGGGQDGGGPGSMRTSPFICIRIVGQRAPTALPKHALAGRAAERNQDALCRRVRPRPVGFSLVVLRPRDARPAIGRGLRLRGRRMDVSAGCGRDQMGRSRPCHARRL